MDPQNKLQRMNLAIEKQGKMIGKMKAIRARNPNRKFIVINDECDILAVAPTASLFPHNGPHLGACGCW